MTNSKSIGPRINSTTVRVFLQLLPLRAALGGLGLLSPGLAAEKAARLFSRPRSARTPRAPAALTAKARRLHLDIGGQRIVAYSWGDPRQSLRVLLAHGWSSQGLQLHPFVEPLLERGYGVVAFDQPAHGDSDGTHATLPRFASVIAAVAEHFGGVHAIIAHSLGGAATALALHRGMTAERVVLIAPPADLSRVTEDFAGRLWLSRRVHARLLRRFERTEGVAIDTLQARHLVRDIGASALIIHDLTDKEVPWSDGEQYARYWPDARLLTTDGLGHRRILNDGRVLDGVCDWIAGKPVGARAVGTLNLAPMF